MVAVRAPNLQFWRMMKRQSPKSTSDLKPGAHSTSRPKARLAATVLSACALSFTLVSCGSIFGDRAKNKPVVMGGGELDCLSHVSSDIRGWTSQGSPSIGQPIDCVVAALDKFQERVRDRKADEWTSVDVGRFLSETLGQNDGPQRLDAILKLKQALFGGSPSVLKKSELTRVRGALLKLKPEVMSLSSQIGILKMTLVGPAPEQGELAASALTRIAGLIADEATATADRPTLTIEDVRAGLVALGFDADMLSSWLPVAKSAKVILAGGSPETIDAREWPRVLRSVGSMWGIALRARYSLEGRVDLFGDDLLIVEHLLHDAVAETEASVRAQPGQSIAVEKLDALIDALAEKSLLPGKLTAGTAKDLLRPLLGKILFGNSRDGQGQRTKSLSLVQVDTLRASVDDWLEAQREIVRVTRTSSYGDSLVKFLASTFTADSPVISRSFYRPELADLFLRGRPLVHDGEGLFLIMRPRQLPDPSRADLDETNLVRAVVTALIRGYTHDAGVAARVGGLNESEIQELYSDARGLGVDLGIIDVRNTGAGKRSYMEARLFTSVPSPTRSRARSNERDEELVDPHQAIEWFEMAISGNRAAARLHERLIPSCGSHTLDVHGVKTLDIECFRRDFSQNFERIVPNLPGFAAWIKADASGERMRQVLFALEEAGRAPGAVPEPLDEADTRSLLPILFYTESLFLTWDKNANDVLDKEEIWSFFPVIQPVLKRMGAGKADTEYMQKAIFTWILAKGEPPPTTLLGGVELALWGLRSTSMDLQASRLDVLKVMSTLAAFNRTNLNEKIATYVSSEPQLHAKLRAENPAAADQLRELFQCQPSSLSDLTQLLRVHADELAPLSGVGDAAIMTRRLKSLLKTDARFASVCLPF